MMEATEKLITENLDVWTEAVKVRPSAGRGSSKKRELYGVQKLRELILELAVRGMLVPQDNTDESASNILVKVEKEKAYLVSSGELKKQKPIPSIESADFPYSIPTGWVWTRMGAIGNVFNGNSINARIKEEKYTGVKGLPFIATKDVGYGFKTLDYDNGIAIPVGEGKFKVARKGSVLICAEGGSAGKKCGITDREICFGNKLFANELYGEISPRFILSLYLSPTFYSALSESMTGIIGGISRSKFHALPCPIPPLAEQQRIVAKVDELMALCDQLEQEQESSLDTHHTLVATLLNALTTATALGSTFAEAWQRIQTNFDTLFTTESSVNQLKQTILQLAVMGKLVPQDPEGETGSDLLGKVNAEMGRLVKEGRVKKQRTLPPISDDETPFDIPAQWEWCKFGLVAEFINGDRSKSYPNKSEYVETGVPWINTGHIKPDGTLTTSSMNYITKDKYDSLRGGKIEPGDLVYCLRGATFGKTAFITPYSEGAIASSLMIIRPYIEELGDYLYRYLTSPFGRSQIFRFNNGSAQPNLSANSVKMYAFPLPPLGEQNRIVAKVDELMAHCDRLKASLATAQATQLNLADSLVEHAIG